MRWHFQIAMRLRERLEDALKSKAHFPCGQWAFACLQLPGSRHQPQLPTAPQAEQKSQPSLRITV